MNGARAGLVMEMRGVRGTALVFKLPDATRFLRPCAFTWRASSDQLSWALYVKTRQKYEGRVLTLQQARFKRIEEALIGEEENWFQAAATMSLVTQDLSLNYEGNFEGHTVCQRNTQTTQLLRVVTH
jgi:hypothetical protein